MGERPNWQNRRGVGPSTTKPIPLARIESVLRHLFYMKIRHKKSIWSQILTDGKRTFSVYVPITVRLFYDAETKKWEEAIPSKEWVKVEKAIEKAYPGWFHTCFNNKRKSCQACKRKKHKMIEIKS